MSITGQALSASGFFYRSFRSNSNYNKRTINSEGIKEMIEQKPRNVKLTLRSLVRYNL